MTDTRDEGSERQLPEELGARESGRPMSAAPSPEGNDRAEGPRPDLSARDLQANASQDELEAAPGSDADQANEVPHVG